MQKFILFLFIPVAISCTAAFVSWQIYSLREKRKKGQENKDPLFSKELWVIIACGAILAIIMPVLCYLTIALGIIALIIYAVYKLDFWLLPATTYIDDDFSEPETLTKRHYKIGEDIQIGDNEEVVKIEIPNKTPQEAIEYLKNLSEESEYIPSQKIDLAIQALEKMAKKGCELVTLQLIPAPEISPEKVILAILPNRLN